MDCIVGYTATTTGDLELSLVLYGHPYTFKSIKTSELKHFFCLAEEWWKGRSRRAALGSLPFSTPYPETSSSLESSFRNPSQTERPVSIFSPRLKSNCFPMCPVSFNSLPSTRQWLYRIAFVPPANPTSPHLWEPVSLHPTTSHTNSLLLPLHCHCQTVCLLPLILQVAVWSTSLLVAWEKERLPRHYAVPLNPIRR